MNRGPHTKETVPATVFLPPKLDLQRITQRIKVLAATPRPSSSEKLAGQDSYRIRQGDYRIVYTVDDDHRLIEIIKIGHRREVYR